METRQVTQVRLFKLLLNHMTDRAESISLAAVAYSKDSLLEWEKEQRAAEGYRDEHGYHKVYKQGSTLEWFNPCRNPDFEFVKFGGGVSDQWVDEDAVPDLKNRFYFVE
jgi:hypothetical protein